MNNRQKGKALLVILLLLAVAAGFLYYFYVYEQEHPAPLAAPPLLPETTEPMESVASPAEDSIEAPATSGETVPAEDTEVPDPLPELSQSDEEVHQVAGQILGEDPARNYLVTEGLISKFVAMIDTLGGEEVPGNIMPIRGPGGALQATSDGVSDEINPETGLPEALYIFDPVNFQRYTPQVEVLEAIDVDELVQNYRKYYPLLQQSYRELGHTDGEFEERLLEVIEELLVTPEPQHPVKLIKPEAYYEFADPELEALSAGQKILIRSGPSNASRIKGKLREFRSAIQTQRE